MSAPRWFGVSSPLYTTYSGDDLDPPEHGRDWLPVFTATKRRARTLALRAWRRNPPLHSRHRRAFVTELEADVCPFSGMVVEPLHGCEHGREWWQYCKDCSAEKIPFF